MSQVLPNLQYTKDHEWIKKLDNGNFQVGITDYAQSSLGDIVYVDIPDAGVTLKKGASLGTIESVKAVSDIYAPVDGSVVSKNESLSDDPAAVNADPYGKGWLIEVKVSSETQLGELMSAADYEKHLNNL